MIDHRLALGNVDQRQHRTVLRPRGSRARGELLPRGQRAVGEQLPVPDRAVGSVVGEVDGVVRAEHGLRARQAGGDSASMMVSAPQVPAGERML